MVMSTVYIAGGADTLADWRKYVYGKEGFTPPSGWEDFISKALRGVGLAWPTYSNASPDTINGLIGVNETKADLRVCAFAAYYNNDGFVARAAAGFAGGDAYGVTYEIPRTAADIYLSKLIGGTRTDLAILSADITQVKNLKSLQTVGTTLAVYEDGTLKLSATDASLTSGYYGASQGLYGTDDRGDKALLGTAPTFSNIPPPLAYFEVPVVKLKTGLREAFVPDIGFVEVSDAVGTYMAPPCTYSAVIPSPPPATCIVGLKLPVRPEVADIVKVFDALATRVGVKRLTREEAILRIKQIDDKLTDVDLTRIPPTDLNFKTMLSDYIRHRETLGVKRDLIDDKLMERYLSEEKGW